MSTTILRKLILLTAIGLFSQIAMAQNDANSAAVKQIADIVVGLNHFPSDADLATLDAIIADGELAQGVREMANTVANIEHSANEEGRGAMEAIPGQFPVTGPDQGPGRHYRELQPRRQR